jgi:hypothetical protein
MDRLSPFRHDLPSHRAHSTDLDRNQLCWQRNSKRSATRIEMGQTQWSVSDARGSQSAYDRDTIRSAAVTDEVARSRVPRECFGYLSGDPRGGRISGHIGPDEPSPLETQDDQPVEKFEPDRRAAWRAIAAAVVRSPCARPLKLQSDSGVGRKPETAELLISQ